MGLFWLPAGGDYDVVIRGDDDGQVEVQLLVPKNSQFATIFVYEGLVTTSSSLASLQVTEAASGPLLNNDVDGDGQVDQILEPVNEVRVPLARFDLFLPLLGDSLGLR